ncbi:MAG: N5-glutamine methyltransferase family protein, partial [Cyclobacteriaceae bacterium]
SILDIGTGSGCIAITLQLELGAEVFACDIATEAMDTAKRNASLLGASIKFLQCDILQQQLELAPMDILVSNPPYVTESEKKQMQPNVIDYEPAGALFVSDQDPLIFHKRIASLGQDLIKPGGKLYFEINEKFGSAIKELLGNLGYDYVKVIKDIHGKDRFAIAIWQPTN